MKRLTDLYLSLRGAEPEKVELLPLSGSARKYYRFTGAGDTMIGVIGTNVAENNAFITIARQMVSKGLNAPTVFAISPDGMCYMQEDLGDGQLFALLAPNLGNFTDEQMGWLRSVMAALPALQYKTGDGLDWGICFPDREFNARMVNFDINYFKYDFLKFTGLEFNEIRLQDDYDRLVEDSLAGIGQTFMYRDFQARNIMMRDGQPWFIDFQGGRRGPVQYDLASFLWNAGTHFSAEVRAELEGVYLDALREFETVDEEQFRERYRLLTLVRLLQEFGAYGFRGYWERKQLFIDCVPTALGCLRELVEEPFARYPYLTEVLRHLANDWEPLKF